MTDAPIIETERLILRRHLEADWREEIEFWQSDRCAFVGGKVAHQSQVWRIFATLVGHWQFRGFGFFSVIDRSSGAYIGHVGPWYPEGWPEPEIGWTITNPKFEGGGYAFEATKAARDYAYDTLGWETAISLIAKENTRSEKLATRLGAKYERDYTHPILGEMRIFRHPSKEELS